MNYEILHQIFINEIGLKERHWEAFLRHSKEKTLSGKEFLVKQGAVCNVIAFITAGLMRSYVSSKDADFNTDFYFENSFVSAYSSVVTQLPSEHAIQALTQTNMIYITIDQYYRLVNEDTEWLKFGKYVAEFFLIRKCKREVSFLKLSAGERMADMLKTYPGIEQSVSQYHIASYLGIKPESLSRIKLLNTASNKTVKDD